jgi:hypothetical protein
MSPPPEFWSLAAAAGLVVALPAVAALHSRPRRLTWSIVALALGLLLCGLAFGGGVL